MKQYDAIVIGAGQAGPFLAVRLAEAGRTVAIIERGTTGGTCVNNGCIPTKTMIASARAAYVARNAKRYGVSTGPVGVDYSMVKARKDKIVEEHIRGLDDWMAGTKGLTQVWGEARFTGPHSVSVNGEELGAQLIVLNVGGRPVIPDWPGLNRVPYLTNISMMDLEVLPEHLIIGGGGYVALEFAQMFRRFGSRVTVIDRGERLLSQEDADVSAGILDILRNEDIELVFGARDLAAEPGITVRFRAGGEARAVTGSHLLVATGRRPNSDTLGLGAAGIAVDAHGYIPVNDKLETSVPGIYALGDINGRGGFTHTSYNDFEIVAANLLDGEDRRVSDRVPAHNLYIDPPLGRVGLSESEVRRRGIKALKGTYPMARVGRAQEKGETQGFMKVLVDAGTKEVLGAALLGIEADEVVQGLLPLIAAKLPNTVLTRTMHIHPTVAELLPSAFGHLEPLD